MMKKTGIEPLPTFIYGTTNPAKLRHMKQTLAPLPLQVIGIGEKLPQLPKVKEGGKDPLENAILKAKAYYKMLNEPVFSCDSGLFIEGLEEHRQPGTHVRRVEGKNLTDEEMTDYYSGIARQMGGQCIARYHNAICLVMDENRVFTSMAGSLSGEKFIISSIPHPKREKGFPLDSLSISIEQGQYYYDLSFSLTSSVEQGFQQFFNEVLSI